MVIYGDVPMTHVYYHPIEVTLAEGKPLLSAGAALSTACWSSMSRGTSWIAGGNRQISREHQPVAWVPKAVVTVPTTDYAALLRTKTSPAKSTSRPLVGCGSWNVSMTDRTNIHVD
jgi:hypothetical protein